MVAQHSSTTRLSSVLLATAAFFCLCIALLPASALAAPTSVTAYNSLEVLRPDRPASAGGGQQVSISAAQNEAESFQVLVQADASIGGLRIEMSDGLTGPGGATIPASAITIYREGYYNANRQSDAEGGAGLWPDVLIPSVDTLYDESRNAFPVNVGGGGQVAAWVDILVPRGQAPGAYSGSVVVKSSAGTIATLPVSLQVHGFALPSTSSLKSAFFTEAGQICKAFTGDDNCRNDADKVWQLEALFAEIGLNNRMTIANPVPSTPTGPLFTKYVLPLIQGNAARVDLPGAKLTSIEAYGPTCAVPGSSCLSQWKSAATEYGFADRFFVYSCDEPADAAAWAQCKVNAQVADAQWPGVRKLVTATSEDVLKYNASYTDIVAPVVNYADAGGVGSGKEKWMYTSCMSFSCDSSEDTSFFNGVPGYAIDQPASQARAMGWVSYAHNAKGELYWNTTATLPTASTNQYVFGGNGDGNLFYAGTPGGANGSVAIGGTHDIPLESIRLKRIRDGREDYEYMDLLSQRGKSAEAKAVVTDLFGPPETIASRTTVGSVALGQARDRLASMLGGVVSRKPAKLRVQVLRVNVPTSAKQLRRRGIRALVRCTVACRVELGSKMTRRAARRLGVRPTKVVRGTKRIKADRKTWVTARLTPHARAKLRRERSARVPLRAQLRSRRV